MNTRSQAGILIVTTFTTFFQPCLPQLGAGVNSSSAGCSSNFLIPARQHCRRYRMSSEVNCISLKRGSQCAAP